MWLIAEYSGDADLAAAVTALRDAGFDSHAIEIFSSKPVDLPPGLTHRRSHASLLAVLGAFVNGGLATGFIFYTQHDYPLITGGMPVYSWWATGVITYELAMAGAVAGVVIAFLWESGLLRFRKPPAPALENGSSFIRVRCPDDSAHSASERLLSTGALRVSALEGER